MEDVSVFKLSGKEMEVVRKHYWKLAIGSSFAKASWQIVGNIACKAYYVDRKPMLFAIILTMPTTRYSENLGEFKFRKMYLQIKEKQLWIAKEKVNELEYEIESIRGSIPPNVFELEVRRVKVKMINFSHPSRGKVNTYMCAESFRNEGESFSEFLHRTKYKYFVMEDVEGVIISKFGVDDYPEL